MAEAQTRVVASKFARAKKAPSAPKQTPALPESYGESHLLLLARDPGTLFAAWDIAPSMIAQLKARIGARGFAVSTLTLRLSRPDLPPQLFRLEKKARSIYLKIDGGPSFIAEIGLATPAGRFELLARSAPCFVPLGAGRSGLVGAARRTMVGYRAARALARKRALANPDGTPRPFAPYSSDAASRAGGLSTSRVLGGASDLHRR